MTTITPARVAGAAFTRVADAAGQRLRGRFRLPARDDPAPRPAHLAGLCAWAAALGLVGLPVAGRASIAIIADTTPGWFEPTVVVTGLLGIGLTIAAFAAVHRRGLPWLLLTAATGLLAGNLALLGWS